MVCRVRPETGKEEDMTILILKEPAREIPAKERPIAVKALEEAICLKCSNCYEAMSFANALGGSRTDAWYLCHTYSLKELLAEATERKLDLSRLMTSVEATRVVDSLYYKRATGLMTEDEFQEEFRKWQGGK